MAEQSWWSLFAAAFSGASSVALIEFLYKEIKDWRSGRREHSRSVDVSLEPLLRAADELVGKLHSLAKQDFMPVRGRQGDALTDTKVASVLYLFVQFWSEVEIVRVHGLSSEIARSEKGRQVQAFLTCLQSRKVRLIDRISQRALGEAAFVNGRTMNFVEFIRSCESDPYAMRWLQPLLVAFDDLDTAKGRQTLLHYAVVLHALIDTLDKEHVVTRNRPATPNKLNRQSRRDLTYRVFGVYLTFVVNRAKYIGPQI